MVLHNDLLGLITEMAWGVNMTYECLSMQLECAMDVRTNIPEWFLAPVITRTTADDKTILTRRKNPLIEGHPFIPITESDLIYDRNVVLLLNHITREFWRRKNQYKSTIWKLIRRPITETWNQFIKRMDGLASDDIHIDGCLMKSVILTMIHQLERSNLICRWKHISS